MENCLLLVVEAATSLNQEAKEKHHEEERQWIDLEEVVMQRKLVVVVVEERLMLKVVVQRRMLNVVVGRLMLKVAAVRAKIAEAKTVNQQGEKEGILVVQVVMLTMEEKVEEHQKLLVVVNEEAELKN